MEARFVTDRATPYRRERVLLYVDGEASPPARMTDDRGVVRWDALSPTAKRFGVQLVDVLESWGELGRAPKPERFRREDSLMHTVAAGVPAARQTITVAHLDEAQKLAHFCRAYTDNSAVYGAAKPHAFGVDPPRWQWGRGALCNEHVNFFLAFWFNYNDRFTEGGSATCMDALPTFSSARQKIWNGHHRGYREYLSPSRAAGSPIDTRASGASSNITSRMPISTRRTAPPRATSRASSARSTSIRSPTRRSTSKRASCGGGTGRSPSSAPGSGRIPTCCLPVGR
ncbi:hypothetical protein A7982_12040 [Minicystis rosea]|nr:hypothetical protein A7982_12040 [Minicystis rosea]